MMLMMTMLILTRVPMMLMITREISIAIGSIRTIMQNPGAIIKEPLYVFVPKKKGHSLFL